MYPGSSKCVLGFENQARPSTTYGHATILPCVNQSYTKVHSSALRDGEPRRGTKRNRGRRPKPCHLHFTSLLPLYLFICTVQWNLMADLLISSAELGF